jgi:hypothetical protein
VKHETIEAGRAAGCLPRLAKVFDRGALRWKICSHTGNCESRISFSIRSRSTISPSIGSVRACLFFVVLGSSLMRFAFKGNLRPSNLQQFPPAATNVLSHNE